MFGILIVRNEEEGALGRRASLRLRPGSGLREERAVFRMALFATAEVTVSPRWRVALQQKRVAAGLERLAAQGVKQAILPEEWRPLAQRWSIEPILPQSAMEACAGQAVLAACRGLGLDPRSVGLEVYGGPVSQRAAMQLLTLSRSVGQVDLYCPEREELARRLGLPKEAPPWAGPAVALRLPGGEAPVGRLTVDVSGREPGPDCWVPRLLPPEGALAKLPAGADPGAFAAALLGCGAVQSREIRVLPLDIPETLPYNKMIPEEDAV